MLSCSVLDTQAPSMSNQGLHQFSFSVLLNSSWLRKILGNLLWHRPLTCRTGGKITVWQASNTIAFGYEALTSFISSLDEQKAKLLLKWIIWQHKLQIFLENCKQVKSLCGFFCTNFEVTACPTSAYIIFSSKITWFCTQIFYFIVWW